MNKKWLIVAVAVVLIAGLGYIGYPYFFSQQAMAEAPAETAAVRRGTLLVTVSATGSLVPHSEVSLAFSSGGRVAEVLVEEGQVMEAGQPLARLETDDLALQVAQAEATLKTAEAQLAQVKAGTRPEDIAAAEASLAAARGSLASSQGTLANTQASLARLLAGATDREIEIARLGVDQAKDSRWSAQAQRDAVKGNPHAQSSDKDAAEAGVLQAEDAVRIAELQYEETKAGPRDEDVAAARAQVEQAQGQVEAAQAQVDQAQAQLEKLENSPTSEEVAVAQAQVDQAEVSLEQARLHLEQATLTAPMDGTVTALNIQPGEMASASQPVIVLTDLAALEVDVNLDETDVARVTIGQETRVSVDAFPDVELAGEVTTIAPTADVASGVVLYPVTVRLAPTDPSTGRRGGLVEPSGQALPVRAGMTADVDIVTVSQENALIVPLRAVHTEGERAYMDRLDDGQIERVEVELGLTTDTEVEITSGLAEGDLVAVVAGPAQGSDRQMPGPLGVFRGGE